MKANIIFAALSASAFASNAHLNQHAAKHLINRNVEDPSAINPKQLSVLKILKVAIPTGLNVPYPSGDFQPDWYKNLPQEVKDALPGLYPVPAQAAAASSAPASSNAVLSTTATITPSPSAPMPSSAAMNLNSIAPLSVGSSTANATTGPYTSRITPPVPSATKSAGGKTEAITALAWLGFGAAVLAFA